MNEKLGILTHASPCRVVGTDTAGRALSRRRARIRLTIPEDTLLSRNIAVRVRRAPCGYNRKVKTKMLNSQIHSRLNLGILIVFITARKRSLGQGNIFRSVCQEWGGVRRFLGGHA